MALVAPTAAPAAVRTLSGQVAGVTYPSGTRVVVPVLLDARSTKRARVRTPVVRLLVPRTWKIRVPGNATVDPSRLRPGDAFRLRVTAPRRAVRAAYPTLKPRAATFAITRRGTTLSAAELQDQLAALQGYVGSLTGYVLSQFADLRGQMAAMRAELDGLRASLDALRGKVGQLEGSLATQVTEVIERIATLEKQIQSITTELTQVTSNVTQIQQLLTNVAPGDLAKALSDVATLQALVEAIDVDALSTKVDALADAVGTVGPQDLQTQVETLRQEFENSRDDVVYLCSSAGLVTGNPTLGLLGLSTLTGCP